MKKKPSCLVENEQFQLVSHRFIFFYGLPRTHHQHIVHVSPHVSYQVQPSDKQSPKNTHAIEHPLLTYHLFLKHLKCGLFAILQSCLV